MALRKLLCLQAGLCSGPGLGGPPACQKAESEHAEGAFRAAGFGFSPHMTPPQALIPPLAGRAARTQGPSFLEEMPHGCSNKLPQTR